MSCHPDRRRSERFAELLDEADGGAAATVAPTWTPDLAPLVELAAPMAGAPARPEPTEEFRDRPAGACSWPPSNATASASPRPRRRAHGRAPGGRWPAKTAAGPARSARPAAGRTRAAVLVGVTAGALALSGVSAASTNSVPGDALYQVKRSSEQAQLALAGSDAEPRPALPGVRQQPAGRGPPGRADRGRRRAGRHGRRDDRRRAGCSSRPRSQRGDSARHRRGRSRSSTQQRTRADQARLDLHRRRRAAAPARWTCSSGRARPGPTVRPRPRCSVGCDGRPTSDRRSAPTPDAADLDRYPQELGDAGGGVGA